MNASAVEAATRKCWIHHTPLASRHINTIQERGHRYWCPVCNDGIALLFSPSQPGRWSGYPVQQQARR